MKQHTWIVKTLATCAVTTATIVHAQPADNPPPNAPIAAPTAAPTAAPNGRPIAHVADPAPVYDEPRTTSTIVFVAKPDERLYPSTQQGDWTFVEDEQGVAGWIKTGALVAAAPTPVAITSAPERDVQDPYADAKPKPPKKVRPPDPPVAMPQLLNIPTGWLLPAAVLYSRTGLDTGGGVTSDNRVGLGDVAEFGVSSTDQVRAKNDDLTSTKSKAIQPYITATFRMGVAENRLFDEQPGVVLGFRKSFSRDTDGFETRIAELTLVASKHFGKRFALHAGGALWDASLQSEASGSPVVALHDHGTFAWGDQIRAFGGLQVEPIDKAEILIDLSWAPEFCYQCTADADKIRLAPELSWGVRYQVADFMNLESGVRVPDIGTANLLDAQIFGRVTFTTWGLRHAVDDLK